MIRIEKEADIRRVLEALLNELSSRKLLDPSTIQNIVNEGRTSILPIHN
jgi:hypothetical protein